MKTISAVRFRYSEEEMANAFQSLLKSEEGLLGVGSFDAVYREVSCRQGRPDFIALRYNSSTVDLGLHVPGIIAPALLRSLNRKSGCTIEYLELVLEFSRRSILKTLRELIRRNHVEVTGSGTYKLSLSSKCKPPEIWSFELKLNNPKRAVFQAQQSRAFAERAIIVVPPGQERNYERFRESMQRWHIGLASFDPETGHFQFIRKGRKARAFSPTHQIYALSQMLGGSGLRQE